jgi:hypothetical protein
LENSAGVITTSGPVSMTPRDHAGFKPESLILIEVKGGKWTYLAR